MNWKTLLEALLFPPVAVMIVLVPVSTVFLVYSMIFLGTESAVAIVSYVLAFYTLTVWCCKLPYLIRMLKAFKEENAYVRLWQEDTRLRVQVSLYGTLIWNTAYAVFQLGLGFWHHTFWYYSLAGYYLSLAVMRFFLVRHTGRHRSGENMLGEWRRYRACGIVFLVMNMVLALIIFFMVYWNRTFHHHEITTIAMAAYTFTTLTMAIINVVRYRQYNSPVYSASKAISLTAACVSMLTLESTMLTTFEDGTMEPLARKLMLGISGGAVSVLIIVMAIVMIVRGTKQIKLLQTEEEQSNGT